MKKLFLLGSFLFVLVGCGQKAQPITEKPVEEVKKEVSVKEEVVNEEVKQEKEKLVENFSNVPTDWKVYKNEKYKYSFKYPKDWYIYENIGKISEYSGDMIDENAVVLSKEKLDSGKAGTSGGYDFIGDILVNVTKTKENNSNDFPYADDFRKDPKIKDYKVGSVNGVIVPVLEDTEYPRWEVTRIYARNNGYDYEISIQQLDDKGNIDPKLMKVVNSFVIEK